VEKLIGKNRSAPIYHPGGKPACVSATEPVGLVTIFSTLKIGFCVVILHLSKMRRQHSDFYRIHRRHGSMGVARDFGSNPFLAFYPAFVAAAGLGGFGPGLLAAVISLLFVTLLFDSTPGVLGLHNPGELGRLLIISAGGLGVSIISEWSELTRRPSPRQAITFRTSDSTASFRLRAWPG
jgi:hypothetical protein